MEARRTLAECRVCGKAFEPVQGKSNKYCGLPCYHAAQKRGDYRGSRGRKDTTHRQPCERCGTMVYRNPARDRKGRRCKIMFCSRRCYDQHRSQIIAEHKTAVCEVCGEKFRKRMGQRATNQFCSTACRTTTRRARPKNCINCGCWFTSVKAANRNGKVRYISINAEKTCSRDCQIQWISRNEERKRKISRAFAGDRHPNWMGGRSWHSKSGYRGAKWPQIAERARKRDGYRCQDCGLTNEQSREQYGRDLDVHHKVPFHNFPNARSANRMSNLTTLCQVCHRKADAAVDAVQMTLLLAENNSGQRRGHARGEKVNTAKLTADDVRAIRSRRGAGVAVADLARQYGVRSTTIYNIASRRSWRHI